MKTVLSRRQAETDKAFIVRQWAYCHYRADHAMVMQMFRREDGERGAAIFYQLEARTWYQRSLMFKERFDEFLPGTDVRESELFGPFASVFAVIPERTGRVAFNQSVGRIKRNTLLETDAALKLAMSSAYGKFAVPFCEYCNKQHDTRFACPEYQYFRMKPHLHIVRRS